MKVIECTYGPHASPPAGSRLPRVATRPRRAAFYHWHVQPLLGAAAKRSVRWRRETSLEPPQRHESPNWHSSSLRHFVVTGWRSESSTSISEYRCVASAVFSCQRWCSSTW